MMNRKMIGVLIVIFLVLLAGCSNSGNAVDAYPEKTIEWIVSYPPATAADLNSRILAKYAEKYLPNDGKFVIVNKPGSGGTIGMTQLYNAEADGYTIGTSAMAALAIKPLQGNTEFSHDSFQPLINIIDAQQLFFVKADAPWKDLDEFIAYAKENPGKIKYGVGGAMNAVQVGIESFAQAAGIELEAVAYKGEPGAINAILRGDIMAAGFNGSTAMQYVESGDIRPLFNYTPVNKPFTDVPTLKELGYDVEVSFFNGVFVPEGTPEEIVDTLVDAFQQALEDPDLQAEFEERGIVSSGLTTDEFQEVITGLYEQNEKVLKNMGVIE